MSEHPRKELAPGVTYRQLDYWTRLGLIKPDNGATPGTGRPRQWSPSEMQIARQIGLLRLEGMELESAARRARAMCEMVPAGYVPCGTGWPSADNKYSVKLDRDSE